MTGASAYDTPTYALVSDSYRTGSGWRVRSSPARSSARYASRR